MAESRPNYFLLLDLDPAENDWGRIEARVIEKQRQWSLEKNQGNQAQRRKADLALRQLPDIRLVLGDETSRKAEADAARRLKQEALREAQDKLRSLVAILKDSRSSYSAADVADLVKRSGCPEKEVVAELGRHGLKAESPGAREAPEQLDEVTRKAIRQNLDLINEVSLYTFLDRRPSASNEELRRRADEIYSQLQRVGATDALSTARQDLTGQCRMVFGSDVERRKYDHARAIEAMAGLVDDIEIAAGAAKFITTAALDTLVKRALALGVTPEAARGYIHGHAARRGLHVQPTQALPSETLKVCGYCSTLATGPKATTCTHCGQRLMLQCPRCGAETPTQDRSCGSCGANTGDAPLVQALLKQAKELDNKGDAIEAIRSLDRALITWPDWKPALELRAAIEERQKRQTAAVEAIERLERDRRLVEAQAALSRLTREIGPAAVAALAERIARGLEEADRLFRSAETLRRGGKGEDAVERYEEVLRRVADHRDAANALAACPPPDPRNLRVSSIGEGFRLQWDSPPARGSVTWTVHRRARSFPASAADDRVAESPHNPFDDVAVESGVPYYYAVYSLRGGVPSERPATAGPLLRVADVSSLSVQSGNGEVILRWRPPAGALRVEVWRQEGAPPSGRAGTRVASAATSAQDQGLRNGVRYGYLVVAVFQDPTTGREVYSPGIGESVAPAAPPAPILDLVATRDRRNVTLKWSAPKGVQTQIRLGREAPGLSPGQVLPLAHTERLGTPVATSGPGFAALTLDTQGEVWLVPLSVTADVAVVGAAVHLTSLDDVTDLKVQVVGRNIILTWTWPAGVDEVAVAFSHEAAPRSPTAAGAVRVTRREYDRKTCFELRGVEPTRHYFTVFCKATRGEIWSAGVTAFEAMGQSSMVRYRVSLRRALFTRRVQDAAVELECTELHSLPALIVVGKMAHVPMSAVDGVVLAEVSGLRFQDGRARVPIPASHWGTSTYVRVFFRNPADAQEVRLLPAPREELVLA